MFCPQCSQQQPAEPLRYCSRCGFNLAGVVELLDHNGTLPAPPVVRAPASRNRMMLESSILMVIGWLMTFKMIFWFDAHGSFEGLAKITALLFAILGLIGLLRFLYAFLFVKDVVQAAPDNLKGDKSENSLRQGTPAALPEHQNAGISDYPIRTHTKEMVPRNSVTEGTTKFLDK